MSCPPASGSGLRPGRPGGGREAEQHARLAEEAAASLDYGQERLFAAMARALVCQAAGDYLGMADALGPCRTTPCWTAAAGCTRCCGGRCWPRA